MSTFPELALQANELMDETFDDKQLRDWFNQCQNLELLEFLYLPTQVVIPKTNNEFVLPSNLKRIISITGITNYEIFAGVVTPDSTETATEITLRYDRVPAKIVNASTFSPDIPEQFHELYVLYAAATAMLNDDEHQRYDDYYTLFLRSKGQMVRFMQNAKSINGGRTQWGVVR